MGRLVFVPLPLFLYRFLLGSLVFGFVGLCVLFDEMWVVSYLCNSSNEKEPGVGLSNGKYCVKYLVGLSKRNYLIIDRSCEYFLKSFFGQVPSRAVTRHEFPKQCRVFR